MQGPQLNSLTPEKDSHCISVQRGGRGKANAMGEERRKVWRHTQICTNT